MQGWMRELADYVKRGVWEAGGLPLEFPAMSLGETQMRPTAMLFRNLLAMEVEELLRSLPCDGAVILAKAVTAALLAMDADVHYSPTGPSLVTRVWLDTPALHAQAHCGGGLFLETRIDHLDALRPLLDVAPPDLGALWPPPSRGYFRLVGCQARFLFCRCVPIAQRTFGALQHDVQSESPRP